jgi:16S rRNA (guanine527-N7)-methyltransferase
VTRLAEIHRQLLERWRNAMNLVGPGPVHEHFEDCARGLEGFEATGRWADLGSGAGFPGLVLADRCPAVAIDLVESRKKRAVFLEKVVSEAGESSRLVVRCSRVEDLEPGAYDGVISRAFASPAHVLVHARRILRPGGRVVLFLQLDQPVPEVGGWTVEREHRYALSDGRVRRTVTLRRVA